MAAYAALTSLVHILEQIQSHSRPPITIQKQQMESLRENISFLQDFLENYSHIDMGAGCKEALESRIADASYAAEDIIESSIVDQILAGEKSCDYILFRQELQKVIEDMDLVKKEAIKIQDKISGIHDDKMPRNIISMSANITGTSTVPPSTRKNTNTMVGFDDVLMKIMDKLTGYPTNLQVLPIFGMGGIGKTTLATNVYDHPTVVQYFHIFVWVTISQEYRIQDILIKALSCVSKTYQKIENKSSEDELGDQLYKSLCGRRYLIILDDVWSIEAWEKLMFFFPDNNNGSRIMITTRLSNVAKYFGSSGVKMNFLDEDKGWKLLWKTVFPQDQCCPLEFEEIGKKIARNCKGLPLSIVLIGGILANSEKTRERWEYVAKNLNSIVNSDGNEHCLNILYLSYNHLPIHLKPCFLYMGVYPEDCMIRVSQLLQLWVSEGFLRPIKDRSLEVVAEDYLNELIDRNLILIHELGSNGKVKHCKIHDLLRDLCLREGEKDKYVWVRTVHDLEKLQGIQSQRRISIHEGASKVCHHIDRVIEALPSASLARSLTWNFEGVHLSSHCFRLARVFNMGSKYIYMDGEGNYVHSLKDTFQLVNLRFLTVTVDWNTNLVFPSTIQQLWNLQILIIGVDKFSTYVVEVPPEIWEMCQLKHLEIDEFSIPDPPNVQLIHEGDDDDFILRNLHTLKKVRNFKLSEEVIKRIPNIKKLEVSYYDFDEGWHNCCLNNLGLLNKLESLYIHGLFYTKRSFQIEFLKNLSFVPSLKKLTLFGTYLLWEDMWMIGSLPCLQVLKLDMDSFQGDEWNPVEGEFRCLKFLQIEDCDLVYWNANRTHFPCLEQLVLRDLINLKEIPLDIGQILTLRSVQLFDCRDSAVMSAKNLLDEQVELGNEDLQVRVICEKNTQLESLRSHNFRVETYD